MAANVAGVSRWLKHGGIFVFRRFQLDDRDSDLPLELAADRWVPGQHEEPERAAGGMAQARRERDLQPLLRRQALKQSSEQGRQRILRGKRYSGVLDHHLRELLQDLRRDLL